MAWFNACIAGAANGTPQVMNPENKQAIAPMSFGERAVGLTFNPGGDEKVYKIKEAFANVIDILNDYRSESDDGETARMLSVAITDAQSAQMWGVKGVTWNK